MAKENLLGKIYSAIKLSEVAKEVALFDKLLDTNHVSTLARRRISDARARLLATMQMLGSFVKSEIEVHSDFNARILQSCKTELQEMKDAIEEDIGKFRYGVFRVKNHLAQTLQRFKNFIAGLA